MALFKVPEDVSVADFFQTHVPKQFGEMMAGTDLSALGGKDFKLQFDIDGKRYGVCIIGGKSLEVVEGGVNDAALTLALGESDWRDAVTGKTEGLLDRFIDPGQIADSKLLGSLLSTKGTLELDLAREDGTHMPVKMVFNSTDEPRVKLKLALQDWLDLQQKKSDGPTLFMSGKMQYDGDMMFLMSLQQLI